jgi:hypothetical protein
VSAHDVFRRAPLPRRLLRIARRSPADNIRLVRREASSRANSRRVEAQLADAARTGRRVVAGPFLGELGFELLYWIPALRRMLVHHAIEPERVTVVTRAGAGEWYRDIAAHTVDIFELVAPEDYWDLLSRRRERAGDYKQLTIEALDRELTRLALERVGDAAVVHPVSMYARFRSIWAATRRPVDALALGDYRRLPAPSFPLPHSLELPRTYIALKAYFTDPFPKSDANRRLVEHLVAGLTAFTEVVLLSTGLRLDDHVEWQGDHDRLHPIARYLDARDNLAFQARVVAGACALVSTYGGFSYLGPLLGVPTAAFWSVDNVNPVHLEVLRVAFPDAVYEGPTADVDPVVRFAATLLA